MSSRIARAVRAVRISRALRGKRPRRRAPRQQHPRGIILDYFKRIRGVLEEARAAALGALRAAGVRLDAGDDRANRALDAAWEEFSKRLRPQAIEDLARSAADQTSRFQKEQLDRQVRSVFGVDVIRAEPDLAKLTDGFISENVALIKSIPERYFSDVEAVVARGIRQAATPEQIAADIEERFQVSESRAMLIARDQVGKFFGEVNQARQEELGVERYFWRSVNDERTREEHRELAERSSAGETFAWDEEGPTEDGEHPGEAINCRCFAEPDLSPILGELE